MVNFFSKLKNYIYLRLENFFFSFNFFKKILAFTHYQILKKFLHMKNSTLIYDCKCSPATYGEFIYIIMLARLLNINRNNVNLIIIYGEYRQSWNRLSKKGKKIFLNDLLKISKYFLNNSIKIQLITWSQFIKLNKHKKENIVFEKRVLNRKRIYHYIFNFMNYFFYFDKKKFKKILFENKPKNFISVHARYSVKGKFYSSDISSERNMAKEDLEKILINIRKKYRTYKIVVLTDLNGFKYYKSLKKKITNIIFSKEISKTFLDDAKLLLNSKKYFQYHGGGIGIFATFSNIPYLFCWKSYDFINNEFFWIKDKQYASWQNRYQQTFICRQLKDYLKLI